MSSSAKSSAPLSLSTRPADRMSAQQTSKQGSVSGIPWYVAPSMLLPDTWDGNVICPPRTFREDNEGRLSVRDVETAEDVSDIEAAIAESEKSKGLLHAPYLSGVKVKGEVWSDYIRTIIDHMGRSFREDSAIFTVITNRPESWQYPADCFKLTILGKELGRDVPFRGWFSEALTIREVGEVLADELSCSRFSVKRKCYVRAGGLTVQGEDLVLEMVGNPVKAWPGTGLFDSNHDAPSWARMRAKYCGSGSS